MQSPSVIDGKRLGMMWQLIVLAAIFIFLALRLKNVLGTRTGFERPAIDMPEREVTRDFEVIEGGPDRDITDHVDDGTDAAKALAAMKLAEPGFSVSDFVSGGRGAYEMILMAFESGDLDNVKGFLSEDVYEAFLSAISDREDKGLKVEATFIGVREVRIDDATFDRDTDRGEITLKFVGEMTSVVRDSEGQIVEGNPNEIKKTRDTWTFARTMGADDPNWVLTATGG